MKPRWRSGNHFTLLENGEDFFPAVWAAIDAAQREVIIETFILFEDKVGWALHAALLRAAQRGVAVHLLVDGFGSSDLTPAFIDPLTAAGVRLRIFDPRRRLFGLRLNVFRRMHRKLAVMDAKVAFVGGINFSADHLADYGPQAKQDYAVQAKGPIVDDIHRFLRSVIASADARVKTAGAAAALHEMTAAARPWWRRRGSAAPAAPAPADAGTAYALFAVRDNARHRSDIERHYRAAIRTAREQVVIANAYFFPGYRLLRELRRAARRGVKVQLILQGEPDMAVVKTAAELLHDHLLSAGVQIFEYCQRPLHGKVALVDREWATVGSSNLDPLSLSLNLEANVVIRDPAFNRHLQDRLDHLMRHSCKEVLRASDVQRGGWTSLRNTVVFHFLRRFPNWAVRLPLHAPALVAPPAPSQSPASATQPAASVGGAPDAAP